MLEGEELAAAIRSAIELKNKRLGHSAYGPSALARALEIKQPSASELLATGRIAKSRLPALWKEFADVVGPEHWGLPAAWVGGASTPYGACQSEDEATILNAYRLLPEELARDFLKTITSTAVNNANKGDGPTSTSVVDEVVAEHAAHRARVVPEGRAASTAARKREAAAAPSVRTPKRKRHPAK
jgi:hypothetical protein